MRGNAAEDRALQRSLLSDQQRAFHTRRMRGAVGFHKVPVSNETEGRKQVQSL